MLLAVTTDTWIITGLGFGIVLVLLFCLVYILQFFGWTMQKIEAPKAPKEEISSPSKSEKTDQNDDIAAVAYALYLAHKIKHDIPTAMISLHPHATEWNEKSEGLNNIGF